MSTSSDTWEPANGWELALLGANPSARDVGKGTGRDVRSGVRVLAAAGLTDLLTTEHISDGVYHLRLKTEIRIRVDLRHWAEQDSSRIEKPVVAQG